MGKVTTKDTGLNIFGDKHKQGDPVNYADDQFKSTFVERIPQELTEIDIIERCLTEGVKKEISTVVSKESKEIILRWVISEAVDRKPHNFFNPTNLTNLCISIFEKEIIRNFVLGLSGRILLSLNSLQLGYEERTYVDDLRTIVIESVMDITSSNISNEEDIDAHKNSLIPKHIQESIYVDREVLTNCLNSNSWLVILFLVFFTIDFDDISSDVESQ